MVKKEYRFKCGEIMATSLWMSLWMSLWKTLIGRST